MCWDVAQEEGGPGEEDELKDGDVEFTVLWGQQLDNVHDESPCARQPFADSYLF